METMSLQAGILEAASAASRETKLQGSPRRQLGTDDRRIEAGLPLTLAFLEDMPATDLIRTLKLNDVGGKKHQYGT